MLDLALTIAALLAAISLTVFANWKAGQPWDDMKPKIIPWRIVMIFSVFAILLALVHLANLSGIETGPEHNPFGRR